MKNYRLYLLTFIGFVAVACGGCERLSAHLVNKASVCTKALSVPSIDVADDRETYPKDASGSGETINALQNLPFSTIAQ